MGEISQPIGYCAFFVGLGKEGVYIFLTSFIRISYWMGLTTDFLKIKKFVMLEILITFSVLKSLYGLFWALNFFISMSPAWWIWQPCLMCWLTFYVRCHSFFRVFYNLHVHQWFMRVPMSTWISYQEAHHTLDLIN